MTTITATAHERAEINMTPMIDILLVLLIIFLVVSPMTARGLDTLVPQAPATQMPPNEPIVVTVTAGTTVLVNQKHVTLSDLPNELTRMFQNRADAVVFIHGDAGLEFRQVAAVIDIAKGAGVNHVALMTGRSVIRSEAQR